MTPQEFCYWLQGFFEINGNVESITKEQAKIIQQHLKLVFKKDSLNIDINKLPFIPCPEYDYPRDNSLWKRPDMEPRRYETIVTCYNPPKRLKHVKYEPSEIDLCSHVSAVIKHNTSC